MPDTTEHPTLNRAQTVTAQVRALLLSLGAHNTLAVRVVPWSNIAGVPHIHLPALPVEVVERLLAAVAADDAEATS